MSRPADLLLRLGDTQPIVPTAGQISFYAKSDGVFYSLNSNGVETPIGGGGGGGVSSVSVVTANGVSGVVANPTTTPAITLTLGDITPSSVAAVGTITGSNLSGTNTGDQVISLIGDVTGSGTGTFSTTLSNTGVSAGTYGSASQVPVITVDAKGRVTNIENISLTYSGTVTSVAVSGGSTGLTTSGGPVTTSGTITLGGTLAITNGGTGATTATAAINNLLPAQGGNNGKVLTTNGSTISWTNAATGTVTSVAASGGTTGLNFTGTPITSSGTLTLDGVLAITNGGTGQTTASGAINALVPSQTGNNGRFLTTNGAVVSWASVPQGTVTSVNVSGGSTGLTASGGPVTSSGTITLGGTLSIANGGTGQTTASGAINALLPSQTGNNGKVLSTNGSVASWVSISGIGTVTSVEIVGNDGISVTGSPITSSGTITLDLTDITPTSVSATGSVTGSNLSGTNTGDQTISLTGDVTGTGTGTFATTLSSTGVTPGYYTNANVTVDSKGRITNIASGSGGGSNTPEVVVFRYTSGSSGNFSAVDAIYSQTSGVTATITDGANCIATYAFTGKSNPPKSVLTYGQVYADNTFIMKDTTSLPQAKVNGGGSSAVPDIVNNIFAATNLVTLQTRMGDTGASASVGQRAWLMVVFGF